MNKKKKQQPEPDVDRPLVAVLDYGIGNLRSAQKALQKVGADARLTADPGVIAEAAGVVLPGVGAFGRCMEALADSGLRDIAFDAAADAATEGRPFLGICIGMQMLYEGSDESPDVAGLGVLPGHVRLIPGDVKRPQMQWNVLHQVRPTPLLAGVYDPVWVYFVHSYAAGDQTDAVATCNYGGDLVAAVAKRRLWATQFHPEKSGSMGLRIMANFVAELGLPTPVGAEG